MTLKYATNVFAAGAPPRTPLGELTTLPRPPSRLGRGYPLPTLHPHGASTLLPVGDPPMFFLQIGHCSDGYDDNIIFARIFRLYLLFSFRCHFPADFDRFVLREYVLADLSNWGKVFWNLSKSSL